MEKEEKLNEEEKEEKEKLNEEKEKEGKGKHVEKEKTNRLKYIFFTRIICIVGWYYYKKIDINVNKKL